MTRKTTLALALLLAVLGATALGVALSSAATGTQTLVFTARDEPGNFALDDRGSKSTHGPDIGDVIAFTQTLTKAGKSAGVLHLAAIGVDHKRNLTQATGTVVLPRGTVDFAGLVAQSHLFALAVVGGTGAYLGAHGTLTVSTPAHTTTITIALAS